MATQKLTYRYGGRKGRAHRLVDDDSMLVVRSRSRRPILRAVVDAKARDLLAQFEPIVRFREAGVEVFRARTTRGRKALRDEARKVVGRDEAVRFAGRVLTDPRSDLPVLYTENLFVKFADDASARAAKQRLSKAKLQVKRALGYARGAFFVEAPEGCGRAVFDIAAELLDDDQVELCHPELVRHRAMRDAAPQQWHLHKTRVGNRTIDQHANVVAAWELSDGDGVTIAVIDDGVDTDHLDFAGAGKVVHARDVTRDVNDARPWFADDDHGTACAGVACASGLHGASGVAPKARLMPIRLMSGLGSQDEADAFAWAAQHGADVISCSWGPADGAWWNPDDPQHDVVVPLPDSTRLAIDWATTHGRNGKGCVITWAAGNGNESVDNDGYASYGKVVAVAACNDRGTRSVYSDTGDALWCAFPSSDPVAAALTPGIWTTDRSGGAGYNSGLPNPSGDDQGDYTDDFGGTSSACPGAAGVAALVIARNPALEWTQVKDVLRRCCKRIDTAHGQYDADGRSTHYGYGRLDARKAVELALPPQPAYVAVHEARQDVEIADNQTSRIRVAVGDTKKIKDVRIRVDIDHTWIGDLVVSVKPPDHPKIKLHDRAGGSSDNLKVTYDVASTPDLGALIDTVQTGTWTLEVADQYAGDRGTIRAFAVELAL